MDTHERFTRLWTQAQPAVRGFLVAALGDHHAADDVTQEVAVALLKQVQGEAWPDHFTGWAIAMAKNKARMFFRSRARSPLVFDDALLDQAASAWEEMLPEMQPREAALRDCVRGLPEKSARLVRLRYIDGLAFDELARRVGMTSVAARVALNRLRSALRECIERRLTTEVMS